MRSCFLIFIYVTFIMLAIPVLAMFNLQHCLISSPESLKDDLRQINAYSRIVSLKSSDISSLLNSESSDPANQMSEVQIQQIVTTVPPATLQRITEQSVDAIFNGIKNGSPSADINIREIKQIVLSSQAPEIASELGESLPNTYKIQLPQQQSSWWKILGNQTAKYFGIAMLALLSLLAFFAAQGWKSKLRNLSAVMLITSLSLLLIYLVTRYLPLDFIDKLGSNNSSQELLTLVKDFILQVRSRLLNLEKLEFTYALIASLIFFGASFLAQKKQNGKINCAQKLDAEYSNSREGVKWQY